MKKLIEFLNRKDLHFKSLDKVPIKELGSRKKVQIYSGTAINGNYCSIFIIEQKSRFLTKNANELIVLLNKLIDLKGHNYKKKMLLISSPLCAKAKIFLIKNQWKVYNDFM